jgi:hypothetical protein
MIANQIAGFLGVAGAAVATDYESIATVTLTSSQATVSFSSIPSTYKHLQLRGLVKTARTSSVLSSAPFRFNGDSGTNYNQHELSGNGTSATASALGSPSSIDVGRVAGNTGATNVFGVMVLDILDYADTNKYKTIRMLNGFDNNGAGVIAFCSGAWRSTAAINDITFIAPFDAATGYLQYSSFALYGIK